MLLLLLRCVFFFLNDRPPPEISTLPLHAALPIYVEAAHRAARAPRAGGARSGTTVVDRRARPVDRPHVRVVEDRPAVIEDTGVAAALAAVAAPVLAARRHHVRPRSLSVLGVKGRRAANCGLSWAAGLGTPGEQQAGPDGEWQPSSHGSASSTRSGRHSTGQGTA